jgi:hypothetical protein
MSTKVKPEEITLEDIKICINIIEIFRKYYEAVAVKTLPKSERDFLMTLISQAMRTTSTQKTEAEVEEVELDQEMLDKLRKKYKIKQEQKV